jgi:hypothetical protein
MNVEIDHVTADRITICNLKDSIETLKENIASLKGEKKLKNYQKIDLLDYLNTLSHLEGAYDYYGGNW